MTMSTDTETGHPPMRRKDRAITNPAAIERILRRADVCRVGMIADGEPYVVPLNFGYRDGKVYFHSFSSGRKIDAIRANPRVCFEVDIDHRLITGEIACDWTFDYTSVIGFGHARVLEDPDEQLAGLMVIMNHLGDQEPIFRESDVERVEVVEIEFERLTGKQSLH